MRCEFVSADSKGLIGALSLLLCITFEVHKNGAVPRTLKGAHGPTPRKGQTVTPATRRGGWTSIRRSSPRMALGARSPARRGQAGLVPQGRAERKRRAALVGREANSKRGFDSTHHVSTQVPICQVYLVSYYSNRSRGRARTEEGTASRAPPFAVSAKGGPPGSSKSKAGLPAYNCAIVAA